ncbi:glycoside hydrolase family 32 protein [Microbacterium sp. No. 7]|uniref:glycoside hydrolase family 32 protein n=1 Tax=Microbacterium sp. No. 7 TaxID=1714373 RepID=UPI0006D09333|nr:glycoside hydrolase family 32 protein [Microbacterium sp. No. 7]ALJ20969.1 hypothetical protein AOA12_14105 [Microbacterium sp. No. 7]
MHFASRRNWLNDPNGLVFHRGRYHLFFQYNPYGIDHGHMSWGHASSTDLVNWQEHPVALLENDRAQIYSGSAVIDETGSAGFGTGPDPALVAIYTAHDHAVRHEAQAIAYSLDDGETWAEYEGNPVVDRSSADFRDPKVIRYAGAAGEHWVMVAVEAMDREVVLYRSDDLRSWEYLSSYGPRGAVGGVWECPDLFPLAVDGDPADTRWVLVISLSPGGVAGGSGTQYVVGRFDGVTFVPDEPAPEELEAGPHDRDELERFDWLDYGRDCYAGVTFAGLPDEERTLIAWMSNWDYAKNMPYDEEAPQRGRMTLARRLSLVTRDGRPQLAQEAIGPRVAPVATVSALRFGEQAAALDVEIPEACRIDVRARLDGAHGLALTLGSDAGNAVTLFYDAHDSRVRLDRRTAVPEHWPADFRSVESMPVRGGDLVEWTLWVDRGSLELFADGGTRAFTNLTGVQAGPHAWVHALGGAAHLEEFIVSAPLSEPG